MAIVVGNTGSSSSATNSTSYSFSFNNNKDYVIGYFACIDNAENAVTVTATYNGTSMTSHKSLEANTSSRTYKVHIFGLDNASAGANTMAFTTSPGVTGAVFGAVCFEGQAASPVGATAQNTAGCSVAITTTQANSLIVTLSAVRSDTTPPTITAEANQTQIFNTQSGSATTEIKAAGFYRAATSATSYTVGGTTASTTGDIAIAVEIKEYILPTVALNSPADQAGITDTTPDLVFTGTDTYSNDLRYNLQLAPDSGYTTSVYNAIALNGSDQYAEIANFAGIDSLTSGTVTIEGWFYNHPSSGVYASGAAFGSGSMNYTYLITENSAPSEGTNFSYLYSGTDADGFKDSGVFTLNTWTHVAVVHEVNQKTKVYVNGSEITYNLQNTPSATPQSMSGAIFRLGRRFDGGNYWKGRIGGFLRVWKTARSAADLLANYQTHVRNDTNLIVNLMFSEGSGTTVDNEASAGNDATLYNSPVWIPGPSIAAAPSINEVSGTDAGFSGSPDNSDPFTSGQQVTYTVQAGDTLDYSTYDWQVRALAPSGGYSSYGSFTARTFYLFKTEREVTRGNVSSAPSGNGHQADHLALTTADYTSIDSDNGTRVSQTATASTKPYFLQKADIGIQRGFNVYFDGQVNRVSSGTVTYDNATSASINDVKVHSFNHTVGSSNDRLLMVGVHNHTIARTIQSVTYNSLPLTRKGSVVTDSTNEIELWYLVNPPSGTYAVEVIFNDVAEGGAHAISYSGVTQDADPFDAISSNTGDSNTPTVNITTTTANCMIVDFVAVDDNGTAGTPGANQTERLDFPTTWIRGLTSQETAATATTYTMSWTAANTQWITIAVAVKPRVVASPSVKIDLWNFNTSAWVNQYNNTSPTAETDFSTTIDKTSGYADFCDSNGWVYTRVYADYTESITLSVDRFVIEGASAATDKFFMFFS